MGVRTVRLLKAMVEDDKPVLEEMFPNAGGPDGDVHTTGLRVVVPDAGSPVKADLFDPKIVEFMTLPDFKAWLAKYHLTSS
jgi:ribose transport system substrate-binding protein